MCTPFQCKINLWTGNRPQTLAHMLSSSLSCGVEDCLRHVTCSASLKHIGPPIAEVHNAATAAIHHHSLASACRGSTSTWEVSVFGLGVSKGDLSRFPNFEACMFVPSLSKLSPKGAILVRPGIALECLTPTQASIPFMGRAGDICMKAILSSSIYGTAHQSHSGSPEQKDTLATNLRILTQVVDGSGNMSASCQNMGTT